MLTDPNFME